MSTGPWPDDTLVASDQKTAPGAGVVLAQLTAPTPGVYDVEAMLILTGTTETGTLNVRLRRNGSNIVSLPTLSGAGLIRLPLGRFRVDTGNLDLQAIAAATAGAVYSIILCATRVA